MDWNWLFSSLAQSNAAIVGIFGAFIITKVLSNQSAFDTRLVQIRDLVNEAQRVKEEAGSRYFAWYNKRAWAEASRAVEKALDSGSTLSAEDFYKKEDFSRFSPRDDVVRAIDGLIQTKREEKRRADEARRARLSSNAGSSIFASESADRLALLSSNLDLNNKVEEEYDSIMRALVSARHHARRAESVLQIVKSHPESSTQITVALYLVAGLFFTGVLYPLSLMPAAAGSAPPAISISAFVPTLLSFKGLLLCVGSIFFAVIVLMFDHINRSLRYPSESLATLAKWGAVGAYSNYFEIHEANLAANANVPLDDDVHPDEKV